MKILRAPIVVLLVSILATHLAAQQPAAPVPSAPAPTTSAPAMTPSSTGLSMFNPAPDCAGGLQAGGTFYFLKPFMQNNTAYVTTTNPGLANSLVTNTPFEWNLQPAFAGWLGWTWGSGLGIRARYFQFDDASESAYVNNYTSVPQTFINAPNANLLPLSTGATVFGSPGTLLTTPGQSSSTVGPDHLTFTSGLIIRAVDLEATYAWTLGNWSFLASAGGRYMQLDQHYQATLVNTGNGLGASELQQLDNTRNFNGGGLTGAFQGTYQIANSGFSLYAMGRASFIAGQTRENESYLQTLNNPSGIILGVGPTQTINPQASRVSDHVLPVLELELGVQYAIELGRTKLFFRAAGVNQTYFDAGNATSTAGNLSLFGVQGTIGLNY